MTCTKTTIFRTNAGLLATAENGGSDTDTGHARHYLGYTDDLTGSWGNIELGPARD